jgi:hypothetical protein
MVKIKLLAILLGAMILQGCYPYQVVVMKVSDKTYYKPMYRKNRVGMWREFYGVYDNKNHALDHIENWKREHRQIRNSRKQYKIKIK